jgi:hypothetical protein
MLAPIFFGAIGSAKILTDSTNPTLKVAGAIGSFLGGLFSTIYGALKLDTHVAEAKSAAAELTNLRDLSDRTATIRPKKSFEEFDAEFLKLRTRLEKVRGPGVRTHVPAPPTSRSASRGNALPSRRGGRILGWMTAHAVQARPDPIVVFRSVNRDGETYALEPRSLERLRKELGSAVHARPRVFIAHETRADYEHVHGAIVPQVVQLLTGVTEERLGSLGGVIFRDPVTEQDLPRAG